MNDEQPEATGPPSGQDSDRGDGGAPQKSVRRPLNFPALYAEEWTFFKGRRSRLLALCLVIFLASLVVSHVYFQAHPEQAAKRVTEVIQKLSQKGFFAKTSAGLFLRILFNNVQATLIILALGLIPFLFLPAFGPLLNGGLVGIVTANLQHMGFSLARAVWAGLAPHGVFEIPAMLYAASLGVDLCLQMTKKTDPADAARTASFIQLLLRVLRSWVLIILPLLTAAAAVEAFITPALLRL